MGDDKKKDKKKCDNFFASTLKHFYFLKYKNIKISLINDLKFDFKQYFLRHKRFHKRTLINAQNFGDRKIF
ncbi:hypothetical protein BpHYR1_012865 [Brachionus plicatilis]|uniref:Uncharacterized protein n=1 Tax=Brachionus plicatilis TaxID=10195 RepID=A0A3M7RZN1_BRAPC|nr:hypothetical protein BpHYR1_012865 [Brachionus plicatilis]